MPAPHGAHRTTAWDKYGALGAKAGGTQSYHQATEGQTTVTFRGIPINDTSALRAFPTPMYRTVKDAIQFRISVTVCRQTPTTLFFVCFLDRAFSIMKTKINQ